MGHKMKGIRVVRDYDPGVPLIAANGGEMIVQARPGEIRFQFFLPLGGAAPKTE